MKEPQLFETPTRVDILDACTDDQIRQMVVDAEVKLEELREAYSDLMIEARERGII